MQLPYERKPSSPSGLGGWPVATGDVYGSEIRGQSSCSLVQRPPRKWRSIYSTAPFSKPRRERRLRAAPLSPDVPAKQRPPPANTPLRTTGVLRTDGRPLGQSWCSPAGYINDRSAFSLESACQCTGRKWAIFCSARDTLVQSREPLHFPAATTPPIDARRTSRTSRPAPEPPHPHAQPPRFPGT